MSLSSRACLECRSQAQTLWKQTEGMLIFMLDLVEMGVEVVGGTVVSEWAIIMMIALSHFRGFFPWS